MIRGILVMFALWGIFFGMLYLVNRKEHAGFLDAKNVPPEILSRFERDTPGKRKNLRSRIQRKVRLHNRELLAKYISFGVVSFIAAVATGFLLYAVVALF